MTKLSCSVVVSWYDSHIKSTKVLSCVYLLELLINVLIPLQRVGFSYWYLGKVFAEEVSVQVKDTDFSTIYNQLKCMRAAIHEQQTYKASEENQQKSGATNKIEQSSL